MNELKETTTSHSTQVEVVIQSLKKACDTNDYEQQLKDYQALGQIYLIERSDPINAIALYNFALAICQGEPKNMVFAQSIEQHQARLIQKIKEAENQFLFTITGKTLLASDYGLDQTHKECLKAIRNEARAKLLQHNALIEIINLSLPSGIERLEKIKRREAILIKHNLSIQQIYRQISEQLRGFVRLLVDECKQVLGQPSCDYTIICFGSLARDEATPYSDLEFGILLTEGQDTEENKNYFRALTKLLNIKVINLGETTPRMQDIKELEEIGLLDRYSESPTKHGFCFDGNNREGRKTPLGNKYFVDLPEDKKYELILTPKQMAQLHSEVWYQKDRRLFTVLASYELLEGDGGLVATYQREIDEILHQFKASSSVDGSRIDVQTLAQYRSLNLLQESTGKFEPKMGIRQKNEGHFFNAKYDLYRLLHMVIDYLAIYFGAKSNSIWRCIESLLEQEVFSPEAGVNLMLAANKIGYIRLTTYLRQDKNDNIIIPLNVRNSKKNQALLLKYFNVGLEELFEIYYTLVPLYTRVLRFIEKGKNSLTKTFFYDNSPVIRGIIYEKLFDFSNAEACFKEAYERDRDDKALYYLGSMLRDLGRNQEAKQSLIKLIKETSPNPKNYGVYLSFLGLVEVNLNQNDNQNHAAIHLCKAALLLDNHPFFKIKMLNNLALVYSTLERFEEALVYNQEALRLAQLFCEEESSDKLICLNNTGLAYKDMGLGQQALDYFEKLLALDSKLYGTGHLFYAYTLNNIGLVYQDIFKNFKQAVNYYQAAMKIVDKIPEQQKSLFTATVCYNLFVIYFFLIKHTEAGTWFNKLKSIEQYLEKDVDSNYLEVKNLVEESESLKFFGSLVNKLPFQNKEKFYKELHSKPMANNFSESNGQLSFISYNTQAFNFDKINSKDLYLDKGTSKLKSIAMDRGNECLHSRKLRKAEGYYRTALGLDPVDSGIHRLLGRLLYQLGDFNKALNHFKIAVSFNDTLNESFCYMGRIYQIYANMLEIDGQLQNASIKRIKAEACFKKALSLGFNAGTYTEYANFLINNGQIETAIPYLIKVTEQVQDNCMLFYTSLDKFILIKKLREEMNIQGQLAVEAHWIAYRLLIGAYCQLTQKSVQANCAEQSEYYLQKAKKVLTNFSSALKGKAAFCDLSFAYKLLVSAYKELNLSQEIHRLQISQIYEKQVKLYNPLFQGSFFTTADSAHGELIRKLEEIAGNKQKEFRHFFGEVHNGAYSKALRELCMSDKDEVLDLVGTLLEYQEILSININDQAGDKQFAAIHYAAAQGNQALYKLLIMHGANENLPYEKNITVSEYMQQRRNQNSLN